MRSRKIQVEVFGSPGTIVRLDGQSYCLDRIEPYVTQAGVEINLVIWQSQCADCGCEFEASTRPGSISFTRRCQEHAKRGVRVRQNENTTTAS
jgi:hypothetical protein